MSKIKPETGQPGNVQFINSHFPFHKFFNNAPQPLFKGQTYAEDLDIAEGCFRHIKKIFTQLEVCREKLFRNQV